MAIDPIQNAIAWTGLSSAGRDYLVTGGYSTLRADTFEGGSSLHPAPLVATPGMFGTAADTVGQPLSLRFSPPLQTATIGAVAPVTDASATENPETGFFGIFSEPSTIFGDGLFSDSYTPGASAQPGFIHSVFGE